ncbi:Gfo/Idh/MocA family oxidoreductase [Desulfohalovibrio reitneri]|uniref:Gfo/Idh/MocA family oxidoreductase n=1 Tax=Desulfohalovibrio reitneri TaxID=1307759 RepID=UPI0004A7738F|nr:Gfo/Idh/MocA family oxidoreductase [Desulfohalovibrio reitneri]
MDKQNIAVVGTGYWGKNLVRNFHELGALRLVCDENPDALESMRQRFEGIDTTVSLSEVLGRDDVDGVVIATPAECHFHMAREALLAGKHVYVEKPLVLEEAHGRELIELAEERGRILMVGHLLHYHPAFVKLKEMAGSGELGRIDYIYSNRLNLGKIRREENILFSFAPHDISMILALAGEDPEEVMAAGGNYLHQRIADVTTTHLAFSTGLKAHIFVSWLHPFKEQKLVVVGEKKMAVFDDVQPWEDKLRVYSHAIRWEGGVPVPEKADPERVEVGRGEPLRSECQHFLECMATGKQPYTNGREGLRVLRVLNAAQRSLNGNGCRVPLAPAKAGEGEWFAHESAVIDPGVRVGRGSRIWHFSHLLPGTSLGERVNVGQNVVAGPDVTVGNGCKIQNNVSIYKGVTLEEDVFCGPSMVFTNVFNPRAAIRRMDELRPTLVRRGATLGANCTVVCGVTIGRYAMVGAGAVVTRNVPDHAQVLGNPARFAGWVCACAGKLDEDLSCPDCGAAYIESGQGLAPAAGENA